MESIIPLITVERIEPCLDFWTRLGFEEIARVPHGETVGFVMLEQGGVTLMYQSRESVADDLESASAAGAGLAAELAGGTTTLFVKVAAIEPILRLLGDAPVVVPRRETFYGMDEIFVRAPCGTLVGFAAPIAAGG